MAYKKFLIKESYFHGQTFLTSLDERQYVQTVKQSGGITASQSFRWKPLVGEEV